MKVSIWKVVLFFGLTVLLLGGGAMLYQAGYTQAVITDVTVPEGGFENVMPYGRYGHRYGYGFGSMGFFPLGRMLFTGFFFLMIIGCFFRLFFGRRRFGMPPWAHRMRYEGKEGPWSHHPYWGKEYPEDKDAGDEEKPEK